LPKLKSKKQMSRKKTQPTTATLIQFNFATPEIKKNFQTAAIDGETSVQSMIEKALKKTYPNLYK